MQHHKFGDLSLDRNTFFFCSLLSVRYFSEVETVSKVAVFFGIIVLLLGVWCLASTWTRGPKEENGQESQQSSVEVGGCGGATAIFCDGFESGNTNAWSPRHCSVPDVDLPVAGS